MAQTTWNETPISQYGEIQMTKKALLLLFLAASILMAQDACDADADGDGWTSGDGDCNDDDASIHPGAPEVCDSIDQDCDDQIDEDVLTTFYYDGDGDEFGDSENTAEACEAPADYVEAGGDCDDDDASISPAADEVCDGIDNDCDGVVDDADDSVVDQSTYYLDSDDDGFGDPGVSTEACTRPEGYSDSEDDCDDADAAVNPLADEECDGIDNDCDDLIDDEDGDVLGQSVWYEDVDGDGYGDSAASTEACEAPDGFVSNADDCDDGDADVNPDAAEVCDTIDNDCDASIDDDDPDVTGTATFYADDDGDSYGTSESTTQACLAPDGFVSNADDCDDGDAAINPDAAEVCDDIDHDCDGTADNGLVYSTWYIDSDGDGYGTEEDTVSSCDSVTGYALLAGDCLDDDAAVYPGADEYCDGVDNDCDGTTDNDAVDAPCGIVQIVAGYYHTLALNRDGTVWSWGRNFYGQLGDGTTTDRTEPAVVEGLPAIAFIAAGSYHSLAIDMDGNLWAWGWNFYGQLGDGTTSNSYVPEELGDLGPVIDVAAGLGHTIAAAEDGTVYTWGFNNYGQLGDGTTENRYSPAAVDGVLGGASVAAGTYHTLALDLDGTLLAWGRNANGQLGDGTTTDSSVPVSVSTLTTALSLSAGGFHTLARDSSGSVWAWGMNFYGQLGDGTSSDRTSPVKLTEPENVIEIAAGQYHSIAVDQDGRVWAWGSNSSGQLGDGTTTNRYSAAMLGGIADIVNVGAGRDHSVAVGVEPVYWSWGSNLYGQLGYDTEENDNPIPTVIETIP